MSNTHLRYEINVDFDIWDWKAQVDVDNLTRMHRSMPEDNEFVLVGDYSEDYFLVCCPTDLAQMIEGGDRDIIAWLEEFGICLNEVFQDRAVEEVGFHWNGKKLKVLVDGKVYQKVLFERKAREYMNG